MVRSQNVKFRISPCSASASFSFPTEHQNIICPKNFGCPKLSRFTQKESNKVKIYLPDFAQHQKTSPLEWSWKQGQHRLGCLVSAGLTRWIEVRHRNWDENEELFVIWVCHNSWQKPCKCRQGWEDLYIYPNNKLRLTFLKGCSVCSTKLIWPFRHHLVKAQKGISPLVCFWTFVGCIRRSVLFFLSKPQCCNPPLFQMLLMTFQPDMTCP